MQDTGALWRGWTGLPMVFAVRIVRREVACGHPERVRAVAAALTDAAERARAHPEAVAIAAAAESARSPDGRLSEQVLLDYYRVLDYSLGARQLAAVREFARRAAARGEIPEDRPLPPRPRRTLVICHYVLFKFRPGVSWDDARARRAEQIATKVGGEVPELHEWSVGRNISTRPVAYDFVVGLLDDMDAVERYLAHPFHQEAMETWREISDWVIADVEEQVPDGFLRDSSGRSANSV